MPKRRIKARPARRGQLTRPKSQSVAPDLVAASIVRESFAEYISQVAFTGKRVVVKRHGRPRAALVPIEDLQVLRALEDRVDLKVALKALRQRETATWAKVKEELGL